MSSVEYSSSTHKLRLYSCDKFMMRLREEKEEEKLSLNNKLWRWSTIKSAGGRVDTLEEGCRMRVDGVCGGGGRSRDQPLETVNFSVGT